MMDGISKAKKRLAQFGLMLSTTFTGLFLMVQPAMAAGTYVYNQGWWADVPYCYQAGCPYGPGYVVKDYTGFSMRCWTDYSSSRVSNGVSSRRWFGGYLNGISGKVYVPAPYVFNQVWTPHC